MFQIGHVSLSFSILAGVTLTFSLHKTELLCWSFLSEVKGKSPINSTEQWTRPAKFQLSGQFPPLLHGLKEPRHIGRCVLAAVYLSCRRCSLSKAKSFRWEPAPSGNSQQAKGNDSWSSMQKVSLTALLHPPKELRAKLLSAEILFTAPGVLSARTE